MKGIKSSSKNNQAERVIKTRSYCHPSLARECRTNHSCNTRLRYKQTRQWTNIYSRITIANASRDSANPASKSNVFVFKRHSYRSFGKLGDQKIGATDGTRFHIDICSSECPEDFIYPSNTIVSLDRCEGRTYDPTHSSIRRSICCQARTASMCHIMKTRSSASLSSLRGLNGP